jgi:hypothetical protein
MMESQSHGEVKGFIEKLARKSGWVSAETLARMQTHVPEAIPSLVGARALACSAAEAYVDVGMCRLLADQCSRLSNNLYSKKTRFVYELVQNAEDNDYGIIRALGQLPTLSFHVSHDRIVIDSNEDGFSEQNVEAICDIGKSTKAGVGGYIGEKGIGFKSVFKVARRVHVQSGVFSFAFEYDKKHPESGLGMVTPMVAGHGRLPENVRTRMVLTLHDDCDRAALFKEFESLPDALLVFLRKLKRLSLIIERPDEIGVTKDYTLRVVSNNRVKIARRIGNDAMDFHFWIARRMVTDMPEDEARILNEGKKEETKVTEAEVVLAFPLTADDIPIVENQHVFAFLPIRQVGFKVSSAQHHESKLIETSFSSSQTSSCRPPARIFFIGPGIIGSSRKS